MTRKKTFIAPTVGALLVLALLLSGCAQESSTIISNEKPQVIQTFGEAEVSAEPDLAEVSVAIETRSTSADEAVEDNARLANTVRDALLNFGLAEDDIKTGSYRLYSYRERPREVPETDIMEPDREETIYYQATNELKIVTEKIDQVGEIIDTAVGAGANRVNFISFDLKNPQKLKMQALKKATEQAYQKAEAIAESSGESITGLFSIREERTDYTPFRIREDMVQEEMAPGTEPTPIDPDQVKVRASVVAEYAF